MMGTEKIYQIPVSGFYSVINNRQTLVGKYIVRVELTDADNTEWTDGTTQDKEYDFVINPADQSELTVEMEDYNYNGVISIPTLSEEPKEQAGVTYYYNTVDSNANGAEWSNITSTTLAPGTYYMYAVVANTANYNGYTTATKAFVVNSVDMENVTATDVVVDYDVTTME